MKAGGRIAIVGGGISGVTAAWQLAQRGATEVRLFEASARLGGIVETVRRDGFIVETGPDGWVSEKPWASELAMEVGLGGELVGSNDQGRVTHIVQAGKLLAMPDAMRMMVPTDLAALAGSLLFSDAARRAYEQEATRAAELKARAPNDDESIASFVRRHFGDEVLAKIAGPLLSGVFGGDVEQLSVRAVMPRFVELEREHGSLVRALAGKGGTSARSIFTSLRGGCGTLIDRMVQAIPPEWLKLSTPVSGLTRDGERWQVTVPGQDSHERFDAVFLCTPAHVSQRLLRAVDARMARLLEMPASSAVLTAFAYDGAFELPRGFGFLVPPGEGSALLAGTFVEQKYPGRVPPGGRLLRGFFGGKAAADLTRASDEEVEHKVLAELRKLLGPLPEPAFAITRRWPSSLPQYGVGHLERMAELEELVARQPGLWLLGNACRGVGLPDLVRNARAAARESISR